MIVGITGHRDIENSDWVSLVIRQQLNLYSFTKGCSSLAIGADAIFAKELINNHIPLSAIIPCRSYEQTFSGDYKDNFFELLKKADEISILDFDKPSEEAFFNAGKIIAELSDILFAVWDGQKAKGYGGTADVVAYYLNLNKRMLHLNPFTKTITKINFNGN